MGGSLPGPLLLLALVAALVALAYLLGRRRQRVKDTSLSVLAGIGRAILDAQLDVDALCEVVYQQASRIVDTQNFHLGIFDGDDYEIKIWVREGRLVPPRRFPGAGHEGIIGWMHEKRQPLLVRDFRREWEQLPARPVYETQHTPARAGVFVPLVSGGAAIGAMAIQSHTPGAYSEEDLRLLMVLASQAAGALRNAQLFAAERALTQKLQLIAEVTQQLTAVQPLPDLFQQIVNLVRDTFGYYVVIIFVVDEAARVVRVGASTDPAIPAEIPTMNFGEGIIGWAAVHAEIVHARDVTQEPRYRSLLAAPNTRAEIAVPLTVEGRVLGLLDVQADEVDAFSEDDLDLLQTLARQLALAIQEALHLRRRAPPDRAPDHHDRGQPRDGFHPQHRRPVRRSGRPGGGLLRLRPRPHLRAQRRPPPSSAPVRACTAASGRSSSSTTTSATPA
ncbi:MAG: GAF domain-containing protein [Anaerolineae bacterium]|nr:GAF domain-containing protein [Anaerolineae bacterium]